jgi:SAM-dependent methyltransferase
MRGSRRRCFNTQNRLASLDVKGPIDYKSIDRLAKAAEQPDRRFSRSVIIHNPADSTDDSMSRLEKARRHIEARIYADAVGAPSGSKWQLLKALFTEKGFATRVLRKRLHLPIALNTEDRRILEQVIFPTYLANPDIKTVLFVGCDSYTTRYERSYFSSVNFWTIEPDASRSGFGARQHVVSPLENLGQHFNLNYFDLIICNGVYGWGLDKAEQCEAAFSQCYQCLAANGYLLLGWDDLPRRDPAPLAAIHSLDNFRKYPFPPLGTWRYRTDTPYRHTYDFYQK